MATPGLQLDIEHFLARHWQREPLLLRDALPGFLPPISADELAGLALEAEVESRIVAGAGSDWSVRSGPFTVPELQQPGPWTLLVQAVDQWVPAVAALRDRVDFLPQWRLDDVMVSYATDGGSVGPHFDYYDVFLLQGEGQRLWRLGQACDDSTPLLPHPSLRLLADFHTREEYLLGPGDILYVPPGVAHWGIGQGECTTFSIGFRAPRQTQMLERWVDQRLAGLPADRFFSDPGRGSAGRPGELCAADIQRAREQLQALLAADENPDWFGELVTEPRYPPGDDPGVPGALPEGTALQRDPGARIAWREAADGITVYANGQALATSSGSVAFLVDLCRGQPVMWSADAASHELLDFLFQTGAIYVE